MRLHHFSQKCIVLVLVLSLIIQSNPPLIRASNRSYSPSVSLVSIESDTTLVDQSGDWIRVAAAGASDGAYLQSSGLPFADALTLAFTGTTLQITYLQDPSLGLLAIEVDGSVLRTVNTSGPLLFKRLRMDDLETGYHTVRVFAVYGAIAIDSFKVQRASTRAASYAIESKEPANRFGQTGGCSPTNTIAAGDTAGLIAAITATNETIGADTICLTSGSSYVLTTTISSDLDPTGLPAISDTLTIEGNGASIIRDSGAVLFRLLKVTSYGTLTLNNLTMSNGNSNSSGGAIKNEGTLTIQDAIFSNNYAENGGGALYNSDTLSISGTTFQNNLTFAMGGVGVVYGKGYGGTLYNDLTADASIADSTFTSGAGNYGGVIYNKGTLTVNASAFTQNHGSETAGALYNLGNATIQSTDFIDNWAGNIRGSAGAINNSGTLIITLSKFSGNSAPHMVSGKPPTPQPAVGGAIYNSGTTAVSNTCLVGNETTSVHNVSLSMASFTWNWWGSSDGPSGAGPGSGDSISTNIDYSNFQNTDICAPPPTPTPTLTATPTASPTPSFTPTYTPTATFTPTFTPTYTPSPTPTLPGGVMCIDWRNGGAQGWFSNTSLPAEVHWQNGIGMYGTSSTSGQLHTVSAYTQLPYLGAWSLLFEDNGYRDFVVAQGSTPPTTGQLFDQVVSPQADDIYLITQPYVQLQWLIDDNESLPQTEIFTAFCYGPVPAGANNPPIVDAGTDVQTALPSGGSQVDVQLDGMVSDDGLPLGNLAVLWQTVSGPASVAYSSQTITNPIASFTTPGTYTLELQVDDDQYVMTDTVVVTVDSNLVDLTVSSVDTSNVLIDPATLELSGEVGADITNTSDEDTTQTFTTTFFIDLNGNATYESGIDTFVGAATQSGLANNTTTSINATIEGNPQLTFEGTLIYAFVDSSDVVPEASEVNNYSHSGAECTISPSDFNPVLEQQWPVKEVIMAPMVFDLTGDGLPEVVFLSQEPSSIFSEANIQIYSGDGQHLFTLDTPQMLSPASISIGDLDSDGDFELVSIASNDSFTVVNGIPTPEANFRTNWNQVIAFDFVYDENTQQYSLIQRWRTLDLLIHGDALEGESRTKGGSATLVDLNHDGLAEVVIAGYVLDGQTGTVLWTRSVLTSRGDNGGWGSHNVVADVNLDGYPDILTGNVLYLYDNSNPPTIQFTPDWHLTSYQGITIADGFNAVGNFDADDYPEIVLVTRGRVFLLEHTGEVIWHDTMPMGPIDSSLAFDQTHGNGGPPVVADMDGDGEPEIGVAGGGDISHPQSAYTVFETDGSTKYWFQTPNNVAVYGHTGSTVFDFEGDGIAEIVYGDEASLRVLRVNPEWDVQTPWQQQGLQEVLSVPSTSVTLQEYLVVADVDADGNAEIIRPVSIKNTQPPVPYGIEIWGDANDNWVATRPLWNQYNYHITNINDDGSIPTHQGESWLTYNSYRQNMLTTACATSQPDLTASYVRKTPEGSDIRLTARIGNGGGIFVPAGVSVAFYDGDPILGGTVIGTVQTPQMLNPGDYVDVEIVVPDTTIALPVWVYADADNHHTELDEANNIHKSRVYLTDPANQPPVVDAGIDFTVTVPDETLTLVGSASDDGSPVGQLAHYWSAVSGPGIASFDDNTALTTGTTVSAEGIYVFQLMADDGEYRATDEVQVEVIFNYPPEPPIAPDLDDDLIDTPDHGAILMEQTPVVLLPTVDLTHVRVDYWPADDPTQITLLASDVSGPGGATVAMFDPTLMENGWYTIRVTGLDATQEWRADAVTVNVTGENKPGRVKFSVTDVVVPVSGLPIAVGRTYDSLERNQFDDFGYGWRLDIAKADIQVSTSKDVTLTMPDGRRVTFYFTPIPNGIWGFLMTPSYTAEAGVYGKLEAEACAIVVLSGGVPFCFPGLEYNPTGYEYTDPYGRVFTMDADGNMQSIHDLNNNTLVFDETGIVAIDNTDPQNPTELRSVTFTRDAQGRIAFITVPTGPNPEDYQSYVYHYDGNGDLITVELPDVDPQVSGNQSAIQYTYHSGDLAHLFASAIDPRGYTVATVDYYDNGRLETVTDVTGIATTYCYDNDGSDCANDITVNTTTITVTGTDASTHTSVIEYNAAGHITRETNELGVATAYTYDANYNTLTETIDEGGLNLTTTYSYDESGNRTSITNPLGIQTVTLEYNQYGGPTSLTNAAPTPMTISFDYDPVTFMPMGASDSLGSLGGYTWNERGNPLSFTDANGITQTYTYDPYGNKLTETVGTRTTTYTYDTFGRVLSVTNPISATTTYTYDALGRMLTAVNANGVETHYEYDYNGNQTAVEVINPANPAEFERTETAYDAANRVTTTTAPDGTITFYEYDAFGRQNLITYNYVVGQPSTADQNVTEERLYDDAGRMIATIDANGIETHFEYDDAGHQIKVISNYVDGIAGPADQDMISTMTYNAAGQLTDSTDPKGTITHYIYDTAGRQVSVIYNYVDGNYDAQHPDEDLTRATVYDVRGRTSSATDANLQPTSYAYDNGGRLVSVTNPMLHVTSYTYTSLGELETITDPEGNVTFYGYDIAGRQNEVIANYVDGVFDPGSPSEDLITTREYDDLGNLTDEYVPGQVIPNTFSYNYLNRPLTATYFDGTQTSYTYLVGGQVNTMTDANGATDYDYDDLNRPIHIVNADFSALSYSYDKVGNRLSMSVQPPGGGPIVDTTTYDYDDAYRLVAVTHNGSAVTTLSYDAAGLMQGIQRPNGVNTTYNYDGAYRVDEIIHSSTSTLAQFNYTYDAAGNRLSATDLDGTTYEWDYDDAYRLVSEVFTPNGGGSASMVFTYDDAGNRLSQTVSGVSTTYTYNGLNQLVSSLTSGVTTTYSYDLRGNLTQVSDGTDTTTYNWNARNQLSATSQPDGTSIAYTYDAQSHRIRQNLNNGQTITDCVWDTLSPYGDVVMEQAGGVATYYTLADGLLLTQTRSGTASYYLTDAQGSTRLLTNASGTVTDTYAYTAFGELRQQTGTTPNAYRYTGQQYDALTGLYSLRARYYAPSAGRFLSADAWAIDVQNPVELNRYVYAVNNPVRWGDPSGLMAMTEYGSNTAEVGVAGSFGAQAGGLLTRKLVWEAVGLLLSSWYLLSQASNIDYEYLIRAMARIVENTIKDKIVKILYRGTAATQIGIPGPDGLWVSPSLWTAAFWSHFNGLKYKSEPVICVYAISGNEFDKLREEGHIYKKFPTEYLLDEEAQRHLRGPISVRVPWDFHESYDPPTPIILPPLPSLDML